jgi:hypothetical protein
MHPELTFSNNVAGLCHPQEKQDKTKEPEDSRTTLFNKKIISMLILIDLGQGSSK